MENLVSKFEPIQLSDDIVNFNTDPFKDIDIFPSLPFSDSEIRKKNKSLFDRFLKLAFSSEEDNSKNNSKDKSKDDSKLQFRISTSSSSQSTSSSNNSSTKSYDVDDISFEELIKQENLPIKITSGYRNTLTAQGRPSNHSKRDSKGNPLAYDIKPKPGYTFEDLRKILYNNPRVVAWFKKRGWGVLEEMQDGKSRGFYDIRGKFHYTKASGPHFHIGPDHYGVEWFNNKVNKDLVQYAQYGTKFPDLFSKFQGLKNIRNNKLYFNPDDVNPFTSRTFTTSNQQIFDKFYNLSSSKNTTKEEKDPLLNSPFYLGNNLPSTREQQTSEQTVEQIPQQTLQQNSVQEKYTGNGAKILSDAITNIAKTNPDIERYRDLLMFTAFRESRFNPTASNKKSTSYGLFQMIDSTRRYYAPHLSKEEFGRNITAQVEAAYKMMKHLFESEDGRLLKQRGLTDKQIATLGWLGEGYFKTYARTGSAHFSEHVKKINGNMDIQDFLNKYK